MRLTIVYVAIILALTISSVNAQHFIQVDDGAGHYTILKSQTINSLDVFTFPTGGGVLLTIPTPGLPSLVWQTAGNTLSAGQVFGSLNPFDVVMEANGSEKMRLVSGGGVNVSSQLTVSAGANGFKYVDGNQTAGWILAEDNTGQAAWTNPTLLGFVTTATGTAPITVNTDNFAHSGPITIALTQGSLTSGGSITVGGTGKTVGANITADLNLANANSWTGAQTFGARNFTPVNSALGAGPTVNDLALGLANSYYRISSSANISLTGLQNGSAGRNIILQNVGSFSITLKSQIASVAANQFDLPGGADIILAPKGSVSLIYDNTLGFWEVVSTN
jgi:hypothetical protein